MKKNTPPASSTQREKGFLTLAGEAFHVLGEEIIEGKDKVIAATSGKFTAVKKAIKKIAHKKAAPAARAGKTAVKKATKKPVKKAARKAAAKRKP